MQSFLDDGYQLKAKAKEIVISYLSTHAEGQAKSLTALLLVL